MKIITAHSFRGGTGKTNIVANLAYALAITGKKVGIVDADATHPSLHIQFGYGDGLLSPTFAEFLLKKCSQTEIIHDISAKYGLKDSLFLIPSNLNDKVIYEIMHINQSSYHIEKVFNALKSIGEDNSLDYLLIDTKPELDERVLLYMMNSHAVLIAFRHDEADVRGTKELLKRIYAVPQLKIHLILNMTSPQSVEIKKEKMKGEFKGFDDKRVIVMDPLPFSSTLCEEHSPAIDRLFITKYPQDLYSKAIFKLSEKLLKKYPSDIHK